jgi:AbiJ N-terminal domain 4
MVYETYSERKRRTEKAGQPDVYTYHQIPEKRRNQIVHIWDDAFGDGLRDPSYGIYAKMEKTILVAEGRQTLAGHASAADRCRFWLLNSGTDQALDIIELSARMISRMGKQGKIDEINYRFRQSAIGFQFEGGQIVKVDDQFLHAEVVRPAIGLLTSDPAYAAAASEFMTAHSHYRVGANQDAVVAANRAFESTLKAICIRRGWEFDKGARASDLVKAVRKHGISRPPRRGVQLHCYDEIGIA